ncbi:hypothetical protein ACFP6B_01335 [Rothia nasimurium]|uniref:hypothetical protein n=1 Tax=Rothia nasimurium TaxID=85336 RepID=UPI00360912EC
MTETHPAPTFTGLSLAGARVRSTNRRAEMPSPTGKGTTGINKQPVASLEVFAPAPGYGNGSGVSGDFVGDAKHHAGAYLRVFQPGTITAGDTITFLPAPDHGVTMGQAFAAAMGDRAAMQAVVEAGCYPPFYHDRLLAKLGC